MKILNLVQYYHPAIGGGVKYLRETGFRLTERGHNYTIFTTNCLNNNAFLSLTKGERIKSGYFKDKKIDVYRFKPIILPKIQKYIPHLKYGPIIPQVFLKKMDYDIIQTDSFPYFHNYLAYYLSRLHNIPLIANPEIKETTRYNNFHIKILKYARAVIARSEWEIEWLKKQGINQKKIHLIQNGVNIEIFENANPRKIKEKYQKRIVLFVGRLTEAKGLGHVIKAMSDIDAVLLIVGKENDYSKKIKSSLNKEQKKKIVFVGPVYNEKKIAEYYKACDVFVYPSADDSFGITYLEAWACKKPVIGCALGGVKNVIDDRKNGLFVEYGNIKEIRDKIKYLLDNPILANEYGENGYEKVKNKWTWEIITDKLEEVFKSVL